MSEPKDEDWRKHEWRCDDDYDDDEPDGVELSDRDDEVIDVEDCEDE